MYRKPNHGKKPNLSQFGLLDIPDLDDGDHESMDLSDDDMDLEAELAAISGGTRKPRPRKPAPVPAANLDAMIAASLQDVPSDEDDSGDEDDPDLLSELNELSIDDEAPPPPRSSRPAPAPPTSASAESSTISLLQERISNYTIAEKNAKASGESSRARRFGRGLKTLNDLLKQAKAGRPVKDDDIPPPVTLGKAAPSAPEATPSPDQPVSPSRPPPDQPADRPPVPPRSTSIEAPLVDLGPEPPSHPEPREPPPPPPNEDSPSLSPERQRGLQVILGRKNEFKSAALSCKHSGDKAMALEYLKVVKQFDMVVEAYKSGQEMDLNELPTVDGIAAMIRSPKEEDSTQTAAEPTPAPPTEAPGLITASTVDEALRQRLAYFQQQESKAKEEGNSSKSRRMGRIAKQYADAVKLNAAGKPISVDELPTPPGYAPLPDAGSPSSVPSPSPRPSPARPPPSPAPSPSPAPRASSSRYEKQIAFLMQRQKQFKEAAIKAKKEGNIDQAKEYLRAAKGFDAVIEAAKGGLAVDLKSLPLPPKAKNDLEHTFEEVSAEDCDPSPSSPILATDGDVIARLHQQLANQLKLCLSNREHNSAMGNVAEANRFEHLAVAVKQDLDLVAVAKGLGQTPKFHYESRKFAVVQCNTDLNENDLELTIVRGIAYNVPNPKEIDTYVRFEFPYPQEAPVSDRTATVKDTNSPTYDAVFHLAIHRSSRACQRFFKRHAIKLEVYSKGFRASDMQVSSISDARNLVEKLTHYSGWFRNDALLGSVTVKLAPLETQVTLHDSFPLMEGRRTAGGSIEVKLRVRTPLQQQQIETSTHRWLVIDH